MNTIISNQQFDEERALYHLVDTRVENCRFEGPADGESALKEARNICVVNTNFSLRYPLWHVEGFTLENCSMDEKARAAIWYAKNGDIRGSEEFFRCFPGIRLEVQKYHPGRHLCPGGVSVPGQPGCDLGPGADEG